MDLISKLAQNLLPPGADLALDTGELARIENALLASKAPETWRKYRASVGAWVDWSTARSWPAWPVQAAPLAAWVTELADAGIASTTIQRHLAGIRAAVRARGEDWPDIAAVISGIRRGQAGRHKRQASPIGVAELARLVAACELSTRIGQRDRALLLVGWAGAFRRSELAAFRWADVTEDRGILLFHVRRSKADQAGAGALVGVRPAVRHPELCPVAALAAWRAVVVANEHGQVAVDAPMFRGLYASDELRPGPLTARAIARAVNRRAELAQLGAGLWSGHSLRSGFATEAADRGVPEHRIRRITRHSSPSGLAPYLRFREAVDAAPELL